MARCLASVVALGIWVSQFLFENGGGSSRVLVFPTICAFGWRRSLYDVKKIRERTNLCSPLNVYDGCAERRSYRRRG
jgi:hypothetical protein